MPEVPDWRPSPMQGSDVMPLFDQRGRGLHVHDLGRAGIADRAGAADEQHRVLVDLQRRIVDAVVIVLRARRTRRRCPRRRSGSFGFDR